MLIPPYKMRGMIFVDLENLKESIWRVDSSRQVDFKRFHKQIFDFIIKRLNWGKYNPDLIRAHIYTGEYTDSLISKIKNEAEKFPSGSEGHVKLSRFLFNIKERQKKQKKDFNHSVYCDFLEFKTTPLHFYPSGAAIEKSIFQKGTDVQLAVDLVHHAYEDNYDFAVICSGDADLLSSLELIKMKGKKVVLFSHTTIASRSMIKKSDFFLSLDSLSQNELDLISLSQKINSMDQK